VACGTLTQPAILGTHLLRRPRVRRPSYSRLLVSPAWRPPAAAKRPDIRLRRSGVASPTIRSRRWKSRPIVGALRGHR